MRRLALGLLLVGLGSGCILPLAPEFSEERNQPPFVVQVQPAAGLQVSVDHPVFEVVVQDPNRTDTLYARWLIDYPPFNTDVSRVREVPPQSSQGEDPENRHALRFQPDCTQQGLSPSLTTHRLMLVVADRPFLPDSAGVRRFEEVPPEAFTTRVHWSFDMDCPR